MSAAIELVATEFVLLAIGCFFLLRYYAASMVSRDVFVAVYLSWVLGFASVLFLPYDLSVTLVENEKSVILERVWKFVYWSTFILAWAVLPIQMEYHGSGHFSFKEKMWDSVYNLIFSGILAVLAGVIYIIYLVSTSGGTFSQVIGFVMAMGNTYGVLLITLLMGNGLVALPMHLWRLGDIERGLRELYLSAAYVEESFQDARYELEDCEAEVQNIVGLLDKSGSAALRSEVGPFVEILSNKVTNFQFVKRSKSRAYVRGFQFDKVEDSVLTTKKHLIKLHARLMTAQLKARASERRWNVLISECERQQEISSMRESNQGLVDAMRAGTGPSSSTSGAASSPPANPNPSLLFILCNPWTWRTPDFLRPYCEGLYVLWAQQLYVHSCRGAAVVCGLMSVLILWSEMLMSSQMHSPIGLMMTAYDYQTSSSVMVQGVSFVALMYMSMCTYWPLFRINIGWTYKLQGPQQSSPFSLIFNAEYLSRLQFTIGYNFLMYLNVPKTSNTAFNQLMQNIDLIPVFGTSFAVYIPLIMLIVALLTLFDGFGRIVKVLGIEWEDATSDSHNGLSCTCRNRDQEIALDPQLQEKIRTGKLIVSNEVKQRRANDLMSDGHSGRTANTNNNNDLSHKKPHVMRIGAPTNSTLMTEALISSNATYNPTYRNIVASADIENDQDLDLDLSDHQLSYGGGGPSRGGYSRPGSDRGLELGRNGGLSAAEAAAKNSLFGFSGNSSRQGSSPNANNTTRRAGTDLFSISNDEAVNPYAGRYSDV